MFTSSKFAKRVHSCTHDNYFLNILHVFRKYYIYKTKIIKKTQYMREFKFFNGTKFIEVNYNYFLYNLYMTTILQNKNLLFFARNIINITLFLSLIISIFTQKPFYVILTILITISQMSNRLFKFICKKIMGKKTYKIIGNGRRPKKIKSNSYGMPSGHSQFAGAISTYIILHNYKNIFIVLSSIMAMLYIMYSRVYEKFHTVQQTIIGSFIGCIYGYYAYEYYKLNL